MRDGDTLVARAGRVVNHRGRTRIEEMRRRQRERRVGTNANTATNATNATNATATSSAANVGRRCVRGRRRRMRMPAVRVLVLLVLVLLPVLLQCAKVRGFAAVSLVNLGQQVDDLGRQRGRRRRH